MSDPREVGLPPAGAGPSFVASPAALAGVRRRRHRRRQQRLAATGAALAVLAVLAITRGPGGLGDTLQQDQPAAPGGLTSTTPIPAVSSSRAPSGRGPLAPSAEPTAKALPAPVPLTSSSTAPRPTTTVTAAATKDATQVRRAETARGLDVCRMSAEGWAATGWCFTAVLPDEWRAGHPSTLAVALCRTGSAAAPVRFPNAQQAAWTITSGHRRYWSSSEQGTPFSAGETVTVQPGRCLRWRVIWNVTTQGRAMPAGDYLLSWNTGSDLRSPSGRAYRDSQNVTIES